MNIFKNKIVQGISVTVGGAVVLGIGAIILKPVQNQQKEYRDKIETVPVIEKKVDTLGRKVADISCQLYEKNERDEEILKVLKEMQINVSTINQKQNLVIYKVSKTDPVLLERIEDINNAMKSYKELMYMPPKYDTVRIMRDVRNHKIGVRKINEIITDDIKLLADGQ